MGRYANKVRCADLVCRVESDLVRNMQGCLITILQLGYLMPGFGARTLTEPRMYW